MVKKYPDSKNKERPTVRQQRFAFLPASGIHPQAHQPLSGTAQPRLLTLPRARQA
ncbi:hypothetical protein [Pantoea sp. AMG 501]|uniref:hypothetical protein n=1 Tax=Pantoea sp. AMG 501 TaxID=2008894 RepID=UPI0014835A7D|nr:hypothetical protein [Pantoea sp. AMG 501]